MLSCGVNYDTQSIIIPSPVLHVFVTKVHLCSYFFLCHVVIVYYHHSYWCRSYSYHPLMHFLIVLVILEEHREVTSHLKCE